MISELSRSSASISAVTLRGGSPFATLRASTTSSKSFVTVSESSLASRTGSLYTEAAGSE